MAGFKTSVHTLKEVQTRSAGKVTVVDKVKPYIRFVSESEKVLAHQGRLFYENETRVPKDAVPAWFWTEWDKVNDAGKAKVGGDEIEKLRPVKADKPGNGDSGEVYSPPAEAAPPKPAAKKRAKKKTSRRKTTRRQVASPKPEASENTSDGITG